MLTNRASLTNHTWLKVKDAFAVDIYAPRSVGQLAEMLENSALPHLILGNGSNTLIGNFDGVVIKTQNLNQIEFQPGHVIVGAGVQPKSLLSVCMDLSLCGFEFISTIPGTIGGMAMMNAGAHGDCMEHHVLWVEVLVKNRFGKYTLHRLNREEIQFGYRRSSIEGVVTRVALRTRQVEPQVSREAIRNMMEYINSVQPRHMTLGSTFKNSDLPAWQMIDNIGTEYSTSENVEFSAKHKNFLINRGNATPKEICELIRKVQHRVREVHGRTLELEIKVYGDCD